jgi:hypothetical protein
MEGDSVEVAGRVLEGPIAIGARFTSLKAGATTIDLEDVVVRQISLYGREIDSVEEVLTPTLTLTGADVSRLQEDAELCG